MPSRDPHWRARLVEVQDLCLVAHTPDGVSRAVLQLVAVLADEWEAWGTDTEVLVSWSGLVKSARPARRVTTRGSDRLRVGGVENK